MSRATFAKGLDPTRLRELLDQPLDDSMKGVPLGVRTTLAEVPSQGWNVAAGDLSLPVTTLYADAVASNLQAMAEYCRRSGASFAPHGKTTMAPQIFDRQLRAGAWGLTCATPTQAAVMRRFGVPRILVANELTEAGAWRWVVRELDRDPGFQLFSLVDSVGTVGLVDAILRPLSPVRPLDVLLEVGVDGGRAGVRTVEQAVDVARAVKASPYLRLVGVEAYEGLVTAGGDREALDALDSFLTRVRETTLALGAAGLLEREEIIVTAGGSAYFDRVVANLSGWDETDRPVRLVLRSGCYVSHDAGKYEQLSPLDGRAPDDEPLRLQNALTAWASVLSAPEPGLVILGTGKRDVAHDLTLPVPRTRFRSDGSSLDLRGGAETVKLMDQHAFLRVGDLDVTPGDVVALDCSHPCTAFDKTTFVPLVDRDHTVVDAVRTFF
ncbi:MAG: alanine racemase [Marmoricola sp.]